jgi:phage terminase small subunit
MYNKAEQSDSPSLTDKQRAFVLEYVKDFNGTQAAIRAGYSEDSASEIAYENLRKPQIRQQIDRHFEDMGLTADRILAEQMTLAFGDMGDFLEISAGGGLTLKDGADLTGKTKLIRKIKEKRKILTKAEGDGEEMIIDSQIELELYDRQKALDVLGKHTSGRERINAPKPATINPKDEPAEQALSLLQQAIEQVQQGQLDPKLASGIASITTALLKANEQANIEDRLSILESVLKSQSKQSDFTFE